MNGGGSTTEQMKNCMVGYLIDKVGEHQQRW